MWRLTNLSSSISVQSNADIELLLWSIMIILTYEYQRKISEILLSGKIFIYDGQGVVNGDSIIYLNAY